jgi:all-trans-retinol dehydrogenase (NAD+)
MVFDKTFDKIEYKKADEAKFKVSFSTALYTQLVTFSTMLFMLIHESILGIIKLIQGPKLHEIKGQLCLVTGGANGLGREIALRFAKEGCNIVIADIVSTDNTVKEISETYGVKCRGFTCDVSDNDSIQKLKSDIEASMGPINILVNNAGLLFMGPLLKCPLDHIERCVSVNLVSHFKVSF